MFSRLNANQKGMILVMVPVVFQLLFVAAIYLPLSNFARTLESMSRGKDMLFALQENEIRLSRVVCALTVSGGNLGPPESSNVLEQLRHALVADSVWKKYKTSENPELAHAAELGEKIEWDWQTIERKGNERWAHGLGAFHAWMAASGAQMFMNAIQDQKELTRTILDIERHEIAQQPEELGSLKATLLVILWAGFVLSVLLTAGIAYVFTREMVGRISAIERKAQLLAVAGFDRSAIVNDPGSDEIAELDSVVKSAAEKLAEARARQAVVLDNSADVICSVDARLKISSVGEASRKIWGFAPDELLGQSVLNILQNDTVSNTSAAFERIRESGGEGRIENTVRCSDGTSKNSIWSVSWSADRKLFFCVVHDVTELRTIERLKQHFLSVASHDLRAPLTSVTLNISIVTESLHEQLSGSAMKELHRVQNSAQRLSSLVNELLELDKLEAGKLGLDLQRVGVSDACEATKALLFGLARQSSVKLAGPIGDAVVLAEEKRLVQMLTNLMSNAIKFSPKDGTVTLSVESEGGFAEIRISDEGPGIAPADCALIFDKFSQTHTAARTEIKGTGLGLAVVKALAESHNGAVGVDSQLGKGSTFWLRIPLADSKEGS